LIIIIGHWLKALRGGTESLQRHTEFSELRTIMGFDRDFRSSLQVDRRSSIE
jgi:hypothetical protein